VNNLNLKETLKTIKLNESTISMILGAIVIVVVGVMIINFFGNTDQGEVVPPAESEAADNLPNAHIVQDGEDLWSIAEKYYGNGYYWTKIAQANDITNPNQIEVGQKLTLPDVEEQGEIAEATTAPEETNTPIPSSSPTPTVEPTATPTPTPSELGEEPIRGATYTVERGDNLWNIAVRAYGDGFKWVEIADANNLANPDLIHRGNEFIIPR
jgi:nucleoid-associated protein YgaU